MLFVLPLSHNYKVGSRQIFNTCNESAYYAYSQSPQFLYATCFLQQQIHVFINGMSWLHSKTFCMLVLFWSLMAFIGDIDMQFRLNMFIFPPLTHFTHANIKYPQSNALGDSRGSGQTQQIANGCYRSGFDAPTTLSCFPNIWGGRKLCRVWCALRVSCFMYILCYVLRIDRYIPTRMPLMCRQHTSITLGGNHVFLWLSTHSW